MPLAFTRLEPRLAPAAAGELPVLPHIDGVTQAHLKDVAARGRDLGLRPTAVAKVGDSNTALPDYLTPLGAKFDPNQLAATRPDLLDTWAAFRPSFDRDSLADRVGWTSRDLLANASAEIDATRPAVAVVMIGTNDVGNINDVPLFRAGLATLLTQLLDRGVVPVVSTIPDITTYQGGSLSDRVPAYNRAIADVAADLDVPVWNLNRALRDLPGRGLGADGLHLSTAPGGSGRFAAGDLHYGFNLRNLQTLEVLKKLRDQVFGDALPDGYTAPAASAWVPLTPGQRVTAVAADFGRGPEVQVRDGDRLLSTLVPYEPTFLGGVRVAVADLTGDRVPDIVTAPGAGGGPVVKLFDGRTGELVRSFAAYEESFRGGAYVAAGDADGDGVNDIAVGSGDGGGPRVRVFDPLTGAVTRDFFAFEPTFRGGVAVAIGGGRVAAGAGVGGGPAVVLFDGRTGAAVGRFYAGDAGFRGGVFVALGDLTGDSTIDVATGIGPGGAPLATVFDGRTGEAVRREYVFDAAGRAGVRVAVRDGELLAADGPRAGGRVRFADVTTPFDGFRGGLFVAAG